MRCRSRSLLDAEARVHGVGTRPTYAYMHQYVVALSLHRFPQEDLTHLVGFLGEHMVGALCNLWVRCCRLLRYHLRGFYMADLSFTHE